MTGVSELWSLTVQVLMSSIIPKIFLPPATPPYNIRRCGGMETVRMNAEKLMLQTPTRQFLLRVSKLVYKQILEKASGVI